MMLVDCERCPVKDVHCPECMVTALAALPPVGRRPEEATPSTEPRRTAAAAAVPAVAGTGAAGTDAVVEGVPLDAAEQRAAAVLVAAGLVTRAAAAGARAQLERTAPGGRSGRASMTGCRSRRSA